MRRTPALLLVLLASSVLATIPSRLRAQEIFDLLRNDEVARVKALIEETPALLEARDGSGNTLLHYAAIGGDGDFVAYLIDHGAQVNSVGAMSQTPLHVAASFGHDKAVAALLARGATLEAKDDYGRTPLLLCARERGQPATTRILVDAGADVNALDRFGSSSLELAAWRGKREVVGLLLARGAAFPKSGPRWQGLLSLSTSQGLDDLFQRLTDATEDLHTVEASGPWLLNSAAAGGSPEIVALLVKKGFDPAAPGRFGWTPLHYAALNGRTEVARLLIEKGAPLDARNAMGQTAYNVAREREMDAVAELLAEKGANRADLQFPVLQGDYLGQTPPGDEPELFAPGIVSSIWGLHSTAVFSPSGDEVYWSPMIEYPGETYSRGGVLTMRRVDGRWSAPTWAAFSGPNGEDDVPFFAADGQRVYFLSRRPLPGETEMGREAIWYADRSASGWTEPRLLDPILETIDKHWQFSLDRKGDLVFAGRAADALGRQDLYMARVVDGKYQRPANLGAPLNSEEGEDTPFLAPDGSYLLFSRNYDLWVSFRDTAGKWSEPVSLGPTVNSPSVELCPIVTADGKYLFFLSQRDGESHAYWVRASVLDKLRSTADSAHAPTG